MGCEIKAGMGLSTIPTRMHSDQAWRDKCSAKDSHIAELEAEVAELRRDRARLDWMCADVFERKVYVRDYDEDARNYVYQCCGCRADSPRAAIDAAMERRT